MADFRNNISNLLKEKDISIRKMSMDLGIYSKKPPHFNEEMNCYLVLYVQDMLL